METAVDKKSDMLVELASDMDAVLDIMKESGQWLAEMSPQIYGVFWLMAKRGNRNVGCFLMQRMSVFEVRAHICMRPMHRGKTTHNAVMALLDWFAHRSEDRICKLTVEIPESSDDVIRLASFCGFQKEGFNRESIMINGKVEGQHVLGITREEAS